MSIEIKGHFCAVTPDFLGSGVTPDVLSPAKLVLPCMSSCDHYINTSLYVILNLELNVRFGSKADIRVKVITGSYRPEAE